MRKKAGGRAERGQRDGGKWSVAQKRGEQTRVTSVCDKEPNRAKPCPVGAVEAQPPARPWPGAQAHGGRPGALPRGRGAGRDVPRPPAAAGGSARAAPHGASARGTALPTASPRCPR
ncbi:uncharacterized protein LOC143692008 [Agelaius phoeniceus]|uniref:uncharacterized protein LOC143692008 n=1 Tax=Agelaius phoeniceus TaxID=39638 RepID=UPI004054BBB6